MSLLVVGSLHLDVVMSAPHLPVLDETVTGHSVEYVFGGKGGNQALAAARMGADVAFSGRAGSDSFGDMLRDTLNGNSLNLDLLQRDQGASGMSSAVVDANGDYGAVIVSAANLNIEPEKVDVSASVSLVLLQNEIPNEVNLVVAQKAKAAGAQVWLNAAPARELPRALLDAVDLLVFNRVEAAFYEKVDTSAQILKTLGEDGVEFQGQRFPAFAVQTVSTHGAGDMFMGALAARVEGGSSIVDAIPFAQAAAALHVASDLDARATLNADQIDAFLAAQEMR